MGLNGVTYDKQEINMKKLKGIVKLYFKAAILLLFTILMLCFGCKEHKTKDYPDPVTNPESKLMLDG